MHFAQCLRIQYHNFSLVSILFVLGVLPSACLTRAEPYILTNGSGDGTVRVGVDGFGSFGSAIGSDASNAIYDPVGGIDPAGTVFQSGLYISGPASWLTTGEIGATGGSLTNPTITGDALMAESSFSFGFLNFSLQQRVVDSFDNNGVRLGSALEQTYFITNTAEAPNSFALTRYVDGDLLFDGSISDGGGRLSVSGTQILFETDAAAGSEASTTFVGITANFSGPIGPTPVNSFEVDSFSGLRAKIDGGFSLDNTIAGDTNGDGFIDQAYDVTLALQSSVQIPANATVTYTTQTLFGNAVPPAPGSSETLPLLPADNQPPFVFDIDPPESGEFVWADPDIAVGYEYEVLSGSSFDGVQVPTTNVIPQTGQYEVEIFDDNNNEFSPVAMLDPGESYMFPNDVTRFRIVGINVDLELDPNDTLAFPTGLSFAQQTPTQFSMTPLTIFIPEPSTALLFIVSLVAVATQGRGRILS